MDNICFDLASIILSLIASFRVACGDGATAVTGKQSSRFPQLTKQVCVQRKYRSCLRMTDCPPVAALVLGTKWRACLQSSHCRREAAGKRRRSPQVSSRNIPSHSLFIPLFVVSCALNHPQRKTPTVIHPGYKISRIRSFYMRKVKFTQENISERLGAIIGDFPRLDVSPRFLSFPHPTVQSVSSFSHGVSEQSLCLGAFPLPAGIPLVITLSVTLPHVPSFLCCRTFIRFTPTC